ncbi:tyrosyl-DNA phosphodiesterase 2-like [Antedon mediterranea]|uniref:tyrosyl-DNA phosphodiesterase 2-like n=1 Tax=Antedon mediterranea TaxID=105859 RepID=UPI003AF65B57
MQVNNHSTQVGKTTTTSESSRTRGKRMARSTAEEIDDVAGLFAEFCVVTGASEGEALEYLQKTNWQVVDAINLYFDTVANQPDDDENGTSSNSKDSLKVEGSKEKEDKKIKMITWNIDGLDDRNLIDRTKAVCSIIERLEPDIIFLQEVIVETASHIEKRCQKYKVLPTSDAAYFTAMMLKKSSVSILSSIVDPFENTTMMRALHKVKVKCAGIEFLLLNSHLESTKDASGKRKRQFQMALQEMCNSNDGTVALFGGDTNLRDSEVKSIGGLPGGIVDLWEMFGSPEESRYTWDVKRNNNLDWQFASKPRIRFDRLFLKQAKQQQVHLQTFKLIGDQWISTVERFPSDHFGIYCEFKVN